MTAQREGHKRKEKWKMVKVEVSETERCVYLPGVGTQQVTRFHNTCLLGKICISVHFCNPGTVILLIGLLNDGSISGVGIRKLRCREG